MRTFGCYLSFNGNCREAMTFYANALSGTVNFKLFGEAPDCTPDHAHLIMHAHLAVGPAVLMGSDACPDMPFTLGNNFSIFAECESPEEQDRLFAAISVGATIQMPVQETFWGARFGSLIDQFGVGWMFNLDLTPDLNPAA